jgi:CRISPR-associated protein Cas2
VIGVYDIGERRVGKMLKLFRRYLFHLQRSVFEGDLTEKQFVELRTEAGQLIDDANDSILFFMLDSDKYVRREGLGISVRDFSDPFL